MTLLPELIIGPSDGRPRTLRICWDSATVTVALYGPSGFGPRYTFAMAQHHDSRLDLSYDRLLWLNSTCFDLTEAEALQIRTFLEPRGLRIQTFDPPLAAAPSRAAAHEVTVAADLPPGGDGGMTPPAVCTAGGALDCENSTFAYALTCGEGH